VPKSIKESDSLHRDLKPSPVNVQTSIVPKGYNGRLFLEVF